MRRVPHTALRTRAGDRHAVFDAAVSAPATLTGAMAWRWVVDNVAEHLMRLWIDAAHLVIGVSRAGEGC